VDVQLFDDEEHSANVAAVFEIKMLLPLSDFIPGCPWQARQFSSCFKGVGDLACARMLEGMRAINMRRQRPKSENREK
jgi:hypothetical protein